MDTPVQVSSREFAELSANLKSNTQAVTDLMHLIRGNGTPGLLVRVDRLERAIDINGELEIAERMRKAEAEIERIERMMTSISRAAWSFVVLFILFLAGIGWGLLTHNIELVFK